MRVGCKPELSLANRDLGFQCHLFFLGFRSENPSLVSFSDAQADARFELRFVGLNEGEGDAHHGFELSASLSH
jgi:hypothetical protein